MGVAPPLLEKFGRGPFGAVSGLVSEPCRVRFGLLSLSLLGLLRALSGPFGCFLRLLFGASSTLYWSLCRLLVLLDIYIYIYIYKGSLPTRFDVSFDTFLE